MMLAVVYRRAVWTVARWHFPQHHVTSSIHVSLSVTGRTVPQLTSVRYPNITRGNFGSITTADVEFFKKFLNSPGQVLTEDDDLASYNIDWMGNYRGIIYIGC